LYLTRLGWNIDSVGIFLYCSSEIKIAIKCNMEGWLVTAVVGHIVERLVAKDYSFQPQDIELGFN